MSGTITVSGAGLGTALQQLLMADDIVPGADASYQTCKTIYLYHPLGSKMVDTPVRIAQSKAREIVVPDSPEEQVREAFEKEWLDLRADEHIATAMSIARTYGIGSLGVGALDVDPSEPMDFASLAKQKIFISTFDPLNTSGSLVLNQEPNSPDFQKVTSISVAGTVWHRSRVIAVMHEKPVYIAYSASAFGYVGRSVYQRALFPLKSYVNTMRTDDMIARKAGLLIAKMKAPGSIIDRVMANLFALKRQMLKEGETDNVLGIGDGDSVESLNLQNLDGAGKFARDNILTNIALAADMPAKLLNEETFAEGFGEGTEDAAKIVRYIEEVRRQMGPLYRFMDRVVQHRAWSPAFYRTIQKQFPDEYGSVPYDRAFYQWQASFSATWPSLIEEKESEAVKVDEVRLKAVADLVGLIMPECDPDNKARLLKWAADNVNQNKHLLNEPLDLDWQAIAAYEPPQPGPQGNAEDAGGMGGEDGAAADFPDRQAAEPSPPDAALKAA